MRKKFFNMMEDMKGKIRVYARVRPMLPFEKERGQKEALNIPDELSLDHVWKEKKREYQFDAVFSPSVTQEKVLRSSPSRSIMWHNTEQSPCILHSCIRQRSTSRRFELPRAYFQHPPILLPHDRGRCPYGPLKPKWEINSMCSNCGVVPGFILSSFESDPCLDNIKVKG